ncbi:CHAT domain-containing protein [Hyalangium sp.]|uniref:CHAT domain-containing protein n=1 Tax=Hyalangium sp. TaxID=2028555 RepID=UPI002D2D8668|nr:CHAT domain-containing protein [Hyalangium sp.]HYH99660.1 CHAT domain-containing protein [Hyalangium sp.]
MLRPPEREGRAWKPGRAGLLLILPGLMAIVGWLWVGSARAEEELWFAGARTRPTEFRLSIPEADHYRPYEPSPGKDASGIPPLSLRALASLEKRRGAVGVAAAFFLRGDLGQASAHLAVAPSSLARDHDRAVLALARSHHSEALALLEDVLEAEPNHPQALWNQGLVLSAMGLPLLAEQSFVSVAQLREPGWSEEAERRALELRAQARARVQAWRAARDAALARVEDPNAPLPVEQARAYPGTLRGLFYELVRTAPSREQALALLPLAEVLQPAGGGSPLRDYVLRVAERDFSLRAPLAREYALLVRERHPEPRALLGRLRASGERDILLGAVMLARGQPRQPEELQALAREWEDPWIQSVVEEAVALLEETAGQLHRSERRLLDALAACHAPGLAGRCIDLQLILSHIYTAHNRLTEAEEHARASRDQARSLEEWARYASSMLSLGQVLRFRVDIVAARAHLLEGLQVIGEECKLRNYVYRNLSSLSMLRFRSEAARRELDRAMECGPAVALTGAWILSELHRLAPRPDDEKLLRQQLERVSPSSEPPGRRVLATLIEGRFKIAQDRPAGEALLRRAIEEGRRLGRTDMNARDAVALAYHALAVNAGHVQDFSKALAWVAEELQVPVPKDCVLAAVVDSERTVVVVRGPRGDEHGAYDATRREPLGEDLTGLVPPELVARLRGCEHVEVLAPSPLDSRSGLLPQELAWSYRLSAVIPEPPRAQSSRQLVVANVEAPPSLKLPRLPPWDSSVASPGLREELVGVWATPSRVLAAMKSATEIEIHAHGLINRSISESALIALTPEPEGRYALTAEEIQHERLEGTPVVVLAACGAARLPPFIHQNASLPRAFIASGARVVLAATADIPDSAGRFFEAVLARIRAGATPAAALRDERLLLRQAEPGARWVESVLLFQ